LIIMKIRNICPINKKNKSLKITKKAKIINNIYETKNNLMKHN